MSGATIPQALTSRTGPIGWDELGGRSGLARVGSISVDGHNFFRMLQAQQSFAHQRKPRTSSVSSVTVYWVWRGLDRMAHGENSDFMAARLAAPTSVQYNEKTIRLQECLGFTMSALFQSIQSY